MTDIVWKSKHLNQDRRGYASDAYFEMQTEVDGKKFTGSVAVSFGGNDLKQASAWTPEEIDAYAENFRPSIESQIQSQIQGA